MHNYSRDEVFDFVRTCINELFSFKSREVTLKESLRSDYGFDSIDIAELILEIEGTHCPSKKRKQSGFPCITFLDDEVEEWETVEDIINSICKHLDVE